MAYLISQHLNMTTDPISFQGKGVRGGKCPVRDLNPNSSRIVKLHRILRYCRRQDGLYWTISVFRDGKYTGLELNSDHLTRFTRLVFRYAEGGNKLLVEGVPEKPIDFLLSNRLFGCLWRNAVWDKRPPQMIGEEDSPGPDSTQTCPDNGELNRDHCRAVEVTEKGGCIKISVESGKEVDTHKIILELVGVATSSRTSSSSCSRVSSGFTYSDAEDSSDRF